MKNIKSILIQTAAVLAAMLSAGYFVVSSGIEDTPIGKGLVVAAGLAAFSLRKKVKQNRFGNHQADDKEKHTRRTAGDTKMVIALFLAICVIAGILYYSVDTNKDENDKLASDSPVMPSYTEYRPYNGESPYEGFYSQHYDPSSLCELTFINHSSYDALVIVVNKYDMPVRHSFVRKNTSFTMENIPEGVFIAKIMFGSQWNPEKDNGNERPTGGFEKDLHFTSMKWSDAFDCTFEGTNGSVSYPTYSLTLHTVQGGNTSTRKIRADEFF